MNFNKGDLVLAAANGIILTIIDLLAATALTGLGYITLAVLFIVIPAILFAIEYFVLKKKNIYMYVLSYVILVVLFMAFVTPVSVTRTV